MMKMTLADLEGGVGLGKGEFCFLASCVMGCGSEARGGPLGAYRWARHAWQATGISASQSWQVETTYSFCWPQLSGETRHRPWHKVAGICLLISRAHSMAK